VLRTFARSIPSKTSNPPLGLSIFRIIRDSVVLPLPDSPMIVKISGLPASI
jgi:hypothetical protein